MHDAESASSDPSPVKLVEALAREQVSRDHADEPAAGTTRVKGVSAPARTHSVLLSARAEGRRGSSRNALVWNRHAFIMPGRAGGGTTSYRIVPAHHLIPASASAGNGKGSTISSNA